MDVLSITRTTGNIVLSRGGVIRGITNWGTFLLPKPARKQGAIYNQGHYFILRFDSSAQTQHAVRRTLGLDPRMIRYSVVKMGSQSRGGRRVKKNAKADIMCLPETSMHDPVHSSNKR
ncbi:hypothetical protein LTR91_009342 [Friedmanniomyces endolithicus]|uniref:37S ribosomal protein MRP17, mitochondrial n=1 Tax=Friedmanniomyces endolithicus TaxID=329885 RepID=A0AAN6QU12_9PEZI|nr:hypothetical protein LTR57_004858 [Friedmanniomyces endolithicus]KAK0989189.1 hypothetical protein LTR91_009342 [Friedmanniomyces endolithicus]KAK1019447.1 hypothetical protein LTR54_000089 [Friedmanniomyces endolithicus]KAK1048949.1 hypothetical protein LTS16_004057 [Friedmanniomyces endolithicus]